jgi:hypothetical protein
VIDQAKSCERAPLCFAACNQPINFQKHAVDAIHDDFVPFRDSCFAVSGRTPTGAADFDEAVGVEIGESHTMLTYE